MSKQPPPAPTASAVGPCPTVIQTVGRPGTGSLPSTFAPPNHPPISEKEKESFRSNRRKIKRKMKRNKLFKMYEKQQEEIAYRKAQLLVKNAHTRLLNARIKKDHSYTISHIKVKNQLKNSIKNDHTYILRKSKRANHNIQGGECS